jgi:hypothetical protein
MDYKKWNLATNITTLVMAIFGLIAAITYYFSLTNLEIKYYFFSYLIIFIIVLFVFFYVFSELKDGGVK